MSRNLRYAFRTLVRGRSVTVLAIVAFALGIGVTAAVFSIFSGVLLTPLPYPDPEELIVVYDTQPACATCPASFPKFHDWKDRSQVLAAIGGSTPASLVMTGKGDPERIPGMRTTASLVDVFGVQPALGRWYTADEDRAGGPKLAVLSHALWIRRFNGSRTVATDEKKFKRFVLFLNRSSRDQEVDLVVEQEIRRAGVSKSFEMTSLLNF